MNYLSVSNLSKSFGEFKLFSNVSFGLDKGQKVGLVARNGAGKSTLLKILLNKEIQDEGVVAYREGIKVKCLEQEPDYPVGQSIREYIYTSDNPQIKLLNSYEDFLAKGDTESNGFQELMEKIEESGAWRIDVTVNEVLSNLNFHDKSLIIDTLSGGQKRRLTLAKCLIEEPDLLFLDEPTNHLDFKMVEWLEKFLNESKITILLITHDRYFLDNVCNGIIEMEEESTFSYKGNYEYYLNKKAEREHNLEVVATKAKNLFKKELEWLRRQPKARGTKSKSRIQAAHELEKTSKSFKPKQELEISSTMARMGKKILEIEYLTKSYGDQKILEDFTYFFKKGEKVGVVGDNGSGKSTFLNLITGKDKDYKGKITIGGTIVFGYYTQTGLNFRPDMRVIDTVKDIAEVIKLKNGSTITASQMLTFFNFAPKKQHTYVEKLSGGEKKRLYLVTILMQNPNFLILDEPTNDLDLATLTALENYLVEFSGCVLIVSHDRYFLDRISDHLFVFKGNGEVKDFPGNYTEYRAYLRNQSSDKKEEKKKEERKEKPKQENKKLSYKEKLEFEGLEAAIMELEQKKEELQTKFSDPSLNGEDLNEVSIELKKVVDDLEEKELRWMELADKA